MRKRLARDSLPTVMMSIGLKGSRSRSIATTVSP